MRTAKLLIAVSAGVLPLLHARPAAAQVVIAGEDAPQKRVKLVAVPPKDMPIDLLRRLEGIERRLARIEEKLDRTLRAEKPAIVKKHMILTPAPKMKQPAPVEKAEKEKPRPKIELRLQAVPEEPRPKKGGPPDRPEKPRKDPAPLESDKHPGAHKHPAPHSSDRPEKS